MLSVKRIREFPNDPELANFKKMLDIQTRMVYDVITRYCGI